MEACSVCLLDFAAAGKKLVLSGILFALATVKPQLVIIPLVWMLLWSLTGWKERKGFVLGFGGAIALLILLGQAAVPGWPRFFLQGLLAYGNYTDSSGVLVILFGKTLGYLLTFTLIVPVIVIAYRARRVGSEEPGFLFTCALVFCAANSCQPWLAAPFNQFLLIPALILLFRERALVQYAVAVALLIPASFAVLSRTGPMSEYLVIPVAIQLALPVCILLALVCEAWARLPLLRGVLYS
jgi:hypothetical protein